MGSDPQAVAQTEAHDEDLMYQMLYARLRDHHDWDKQYASGVWGPASCDQYVTSRIRVEKRADSELRAGDKTHAFNDYEEAGEYRNTCAAKVFLDACWPPGAESVNPICEGPWVQAVQWNRIYEGMDYYGEGMAAYPSIARGFIEAAYLFYYNLLRDNSTPLSSTLRPLVQHLSDTTKRTLERMGLPPCSPARTEDCIPTQ